MFMKKCRNHELDPTVEFFNAAGSLYSVDNDEEALIVQNEEQQKEDKETEDEETEEGEEPNLTYYTNYE